MKTASKVWWKKVSEQQLMIPREWLTLCGVDSEEAENVIFGDGSQDAAIQYMRCMELLNSEYGLTIDWYPSDHNDEGAMNPFFSFTFTADNNLYFSVGTSIVGDEPVDVITGYLDEKVVVMSGDLEIAAKEDMTLAERVKLGLDVLVEESPLKVLMARSRKENGDRMLAEIERVSGILHSV